MADRESKLSELQLIVYDLVCAAGWDGATMEQVEKETNKTHQSISARMNELEKLGLIERRAAKRRNSTGRGAWIYVKKGLSRVKKEA
jgi:predicted transcriptional regulator